MMKRRSSAFWIFAVLLGGAAASGIAPAGAGAAAPEKGMQREAGVADAPGEFPHPAAAQWTPPPPAPVPFGTELRERLATAREKLRKAEAAREAAVREGRTAEEVAALDAGIEDLRWRVADTLSQMERGVVPHEPVTPRPHGRAVSSTSP